MRVVARLSVLLLLTLLPVAAPAQQPYVDALPGAGRPVDTAATAQRRQRLMDRLGDAVVLIPSARERSAEPDGDYPQDNDFRQLNRFYYFTMLESKDSWLVLNARAAGPDEVVLLLPPRDLRAERWTGIQLGPDTLAVRLTGVPTVLSVRSLDSVVAAALARGVPVYAPLDPLSARAPQLQRLRADTARVTLRNLKPVVDSMRVVKDAQEIAVLREAARVSGEAHADLMRAARPGMYEYELEAVLEAGFRRRGADRLGYPSIVGAGPNGTILHYGVNRRQARDGELVVVDAAAEVAQYTADVTRTFPVSGTFTPRQRAIYDLVLGTQQAILDSIRPGRTLAELQRWGRDYMRAHAGDLCGAQNCVDFFIHGSTHWIGMDVHDVGPYAVALEPGMVFTVEPGIYLPAESLGVRIEDDVLVTPTGYELLSGAAPRRAEDVERVMREGRQVAPAPRAPRNRE